MTSIWHESPSGWAVLEPTRFTAEALLHDLVEGAPQLLPLAGSPSLVILGREVHLGSGYADLLAVDATGDLAIIELKLASNSEAKRAVVAQVLSYAAFLDHMAYDDLEGRVLADHLERRGFASLAAAGHTAAQQGQFDEVSAPWSHATSTGQTIALPGSEISPVTISWREGMPRCGNHVM